MDNNDEIHSGGPAEFMTLRDFYAAFIAMAILSRPDVELGSEQDFADAVFKLADALIIKGEGGNDYKH